MKIDKYRTDGEICQWVSKICFAYSINSTVSVGSAKLCNHHFLNDGGKMCVFIQCITIPVHRFKIPNVFPIGLSFHGKSFSHSVFFIFFYELWMFSMCFQLCLPVPVFHIGDQQVATLTGGNVMLWQRFLPLVLSSPSLLRAITVKCVHR